MSRERPLTWAVRRGEPPLTLAQYREGGGYQAVHDAVGGDAGPDDVLEAVKDSGLRGRGGAGFPTGMKWSFVPRGDDAPDDKILICNADEMEPGTFKDRLLLEGAPHLLIEAMILSAYALGVHTGWIFLRWAYHDAHERLAQAMDEARAAGLLGRDILGSGFDLDLHVHVSAGRYMCGEETGLLGAIQGGRAVPRSKPPYPQASGAWGRPTVVQNVETLCNVPGIVRNGPEWFQGLATTDDAGTKLYGVSGHVERPGVWELPMGTTARELIEEHAGGMAGGRELVAFLPGGASTDWLGPDELDTPMDYDHVSEAGSRLGTGTLVVLDDRTCPVRVMVSLERFFARESCGWCTPCREGLPWARDVLRAIEDGEGRPGDLELLAQQAGLIGTPGRTFCALAPGAMAPLRSGLERFREAFERHLDEQRCPYDEERA